MASGTPSAQVLNPVGHLLFTPPQLMFTLYYWRENYTAAEKLCGGRIIIRQRKNSPERAQVGLNFHNKILKKKSTLSEIVAQCGKYPIP